MSTFVRVWTIVWTVVAVLALTALFARDFPYTIKFERVDAKKTEDRVSAPAPVPTVSYVPVPVAASPAPAPPAPEAAPAPAPAKKAAKRKRKPGAATKLKSKWSAPKEKPLSLGDLFNVR
jgi:hypothetical protein